jgi:hypothetical protein
MVTKGIMNYGLSPYSAGLFLTQNGRSAELQLQHAGFYTDMA